MRHVMYKCFLVLVCVKFDCYSVSCVGVCVCACIRLCYREWNRGADDRAMKTDKDTGIAAHIAYILNNLNIR